MVEREEVVERKQPGWPAAVAVLSLVLALCALGWSLSLQNKLTAANNTVAETQQQNAHLADQIEETNERMKAQGEALGQSMGLTQKQIDDRANDLMAAQRSAEAQTRRLAEQQERTAKQVGQVQNDVTSVKTDVGGVKSDVATTQADLAATKTQLTRVMGDEGVMSGLIATNQTELDQLKKMGQRNYYQFTLTKGGPAQIVGTIKLKLKKINDKHSKFTLEVNSDDRVIEKKDRNLDEPIQFYSGKSPALFEVVVNNMTHNTVSGYLSTPKSAPVPMDVP